MNQPLVRHLMVTMEEKIIAVRIEGRRQRRNAFAAFGAALFFGWGYAQLVRIAGAPPQIIGLTAIVIEIAVFACAIGARLGEHFTDWARLAGRIWRKI